MVCKHLSGHTKETGVELVCQHCARYTALTPASDEELRRRVEGLDFRADGPPPAHCELCTKPYTDWAASDEKWGLLSPEDRRRGLCEEDFLRLLRVGGHDTANIVIFHT